MNIYKEKSRGLSTESTEMIHRVGTVREPAKGRVSKERTVDDSSQCSSDVKEH